MQKTCSWVIVILMLFMSVTAFAGRQTYGNINNVRFVKNYDGDTITVQINHLHPIIGESISVRIYGIDTPEIRAKCPLEKAKAYEAKLMVKTICTNAKKLVLKDVRRDKYFRLLADVYADDINIANELIAAGLAKAYYGGTKISWCE